MPFADVNLLFRRYGKDLIRFLTRRVACPETAADIAQDALVKMLQASPAAPIRDARAYLFRTATNLAHNHRRHARLLPLADDPDAALAEAADPTPGAERVAMSRQDLARLARAIESLPERRREVFRLRQVEGLAPDEIAARLGISRNMVEKHLRRALAHCLAATADRG